MFCFHLHSSLSSSLSAMEVSNVLPEHLVEGITNLSVKKRFSILGLEARNALERLFRGNVLTAESVYHILKKKTDAPPGLWRGRCFSKARHGPETDWD